MTQCSPSESKSLSHHQPGRSPALCHRGMERERVIVARAYLRALFLVAMMASIYVHGLGAVEANAWGPALGTH